MAVQVAIVDENNDGLSDSTVDVVRHGGYVVNSIIIIIMIIMMMFRFVAPLRVIMYWVY
jgi:hypothetical protein